MSEVDDLAASALVAQLNDADPYGYLGELQPHQLEQLAKAADELASAARLTISTGAHS